MFSIFGKRKPAETPTVEAIQGPAQGNDNEFTFVERKTDVDPQITSGGMMYPPMPQSAYGPMPYPPSLCGRTGAGIETMGASRNNIPINYLQDIPFELSPQLTTKDRFTGAQMQVDGILAFLTRQLSVDALAEEYTFTLERSVQNDCF